LLASRDRCPVLDLLLQPGDGSVEGEVEFKGVSRPVDKKPKVVGLRKLQDLVPLLILVCRAALVL
jgi:hypothetical protein